MGLLNNILIFEKNDAMLAVRKRPGAKSIPEPGVKPSEIEKPKTQKSFIRAKLCCRVGSVKYKLDARIGGGELPVS